LRHSRNSTETRPRWSSYLRPSVSDTASEQPRDGNFEDDTFVVEVSGHTALCRVFVTVAARNEYSAWLSTHRRREREKDRHQTIAVHARNGRRIYSACRIREYERALMFLTHYKPEDPRVLNISRAAGKPRRVSQDLGTLAARRAEERPRKRDWAALLTSRFDRHSLAIRISLQASGKAYGA
jgi:hypothetical protein